MPVATLPPSVHIGIIRAYIDRMRRTKAVPSQQETQHALDSLAQLEVATKRPPAAQ
jgi:hypothetical protein